MTAILGLGAWIVYAPLASADGLTLSVQSPKSPFKAGEAVEVVVNLENAGNGSEVVYPLFMPAGGEEQWWPDLFLDFTITTKDGQVLPFAPTAQSAAKRARPLFSDFLRLFPHHAFGVVVNLSDSHFAHKWAGPGRYGISVRCRSSARTWLEGELKAGRLKLDRAFGPERVFNGTLQAPTIEIEVQ